MRWFPAGMLCLLMAACGNETPTEPGEAVYLRYCFSCHAAGIASAPKVGDPADWAPRLEQGREALLEATIDGVPPGMPPRGLCAQCTDEELDEAIGYMLDQSMPEPASEPAGG